MNRLHNLSNPRGAKKKPKRLGCGVGSGHGKTSGKGHKGQKARSGGTIRIGFEGGQMPLFRRLSKRGFKSRNKIFYDTVNVGDLEKLEAEEIDREVLVAAGLLRKQSSFFKILGGGTLSRSITIKADQFSASAKEKVEAVGGKVVTD